MVRGLHCTTFSVPAVVMLGPSGAGKSNLVSRFINDKFNSESEVTIGVDFASKIMETFDGVKVKTQVWDTGACTHFRAVVAPLALRIVYCMLLQLVKSGFGRWFPRMCPAHTLALFVAAVAALARHDWLTVFCLQILPRGARRPSCVRHYIQRFV